MTTPWKRRSTTTSVDVDLDDFETCELLQALINRKIITESTASVLLAREDKIDFTPDPDELMLASHELMMGRRQEAMIHIERGLGRQFIGRLT